MRVTIKSFLILSLVGFELLSQVPFNILKFEHTAEPQFGGNSTLSEGVSFKYLSMSRIEVSLGKVFIIVNSSSVSD